MYSYVTMKVSSNIKNKVIALRMQGLSISEIAEQSGLAKSTTSLLLKGVVLNDTAKKRLDLKVVNSRKKGLLSLRRKREEFYQLQKNDVLKKIQKVDFKLEHYKLLCAFLYWGEGGKQGSCVSFINSDPEMIKTFLFLLRKAFDIDEKKLRGLIHLHSYHEEVEIKDFWSKITNIPKNQFTKSFLKKNTGKIQRTEYKGSLKLKYFDAKVLLELKLWYQLFCKHKVLC